MKGAEPSLLLALIEARSRSPPPRWRRSGSRPPRRHHEQPTLEHARTAPTLDRTSPATKVSDGVPRPFPRCRRWPQLSPIAGRTGRAARLRLCLCYAKRVSVDGRAAAHRRSGGRCTQDRDAAEGQARRPYNRHVTTPSSGCRRPSPTNNCDSSRSVVEINRSNNNKQQANLVSRKPGQVHG
jgi:hypothetical protein